MAYDHIHKKDRKEKSAAVAAEEQLLESPQLPNSLVMRIMEEPDAEEEADLLSSGVTSRTPGALTQEMGGRLGADLSSVRFHSDPASVSKSRAMGARAWAQGRDIYFGRGGFDPSVAAHELVHTVQQGAVRGNTSVSMPFGAVQLDPDDEDDEKTIKKAAAKQNKNADQADSPGLADAKAMVGIERSLIHLFTTDTGVKVYTGFETELQQLVTKDSGKKNFNYTPPNGVRYLVRAAYRDYIYRDILDEIVAKPLETKTDIKERIREFKALIKGLSGRIGKAQAEELAIRTGMFKGKPKYAHKLKQQSRRRAYEVDAGANGLVDFNPNQVGELETVQTAIDEAQTPEQAYNIFAAFTGNSQGRFTDKYKTLKVDMNIFRSKLKQMARVVVDYPELKGMIGNMDVIDPNRRTLMSTTSTRGGDRKAEFEYNIRPDREGPEGEQERADDDAKNAMDQFHISPREYHGTHELGHALASLLVEPGGDRQFEMENNTLAEQMDHRLKGSDLTRKNGSSQSQTLTNKVIEAESALPETEMLMDVITQNKAELLKDYKIKRVNNYKSTHTDSRTGFKALKNQISTYDTDFYKNGATSKYGSYNPAEFFAEAVADVYSHGKSAKKMSSALVKEYEKRQKKKHREKFNYNKKSWWGKFLHFFTS